MQGLWFLKVLLQGIVAIMGAQRCGCDVSVRADVVFCSVALPLGPLLRPLPPWTAPTHFRTRLTSMAKARLQTMLLARAWPLQLNWTVLGLTVGTTVVWMVGAAGAAAGTSCVWWRTLLGPTSRAPSTHASPRLQPTGRSNRSCATSRQAAPPVVLPVVLPTVLPTKQGAREWRGAAEGEAVPSLGATAVLPLGPATAATTAPLRPLAPRPSRARRARPRAEAPLGPNAS